MRSFFGVVGTLLMVCSLAGAMFLVTRSQETRRGASGGLATYSMLPSGIKVEVGQEFGVSIWLNSGTETELIEEATLRLKFEHDELDFIKFEGNNKFSMLATGRQNDENEDNLRVGVKLLGEPRGGAIEVGKVYFKAKKDGQTEVYIDKGWIGGGDNKNKLELNDGIKAVVTIGKGESEDKKTKEKDNENQPTKVEVKPTEIKKESGSEDKSDDEKDKKNIGVIPTVSVNLIPTATPTTKQMTLITPTPTAVASTAGVGWLKFKVSFEGVKSAAVCAGDWMVGVTVLSKEKKYQFNDVAIAEVGANKGLAVYQGLVKLVGVPEMSNLAVFIKGPKHIQTKYGINNQSSFYSEVGGKISVTDNETTTPVYNFSGYPIGAGDVVGNGNNQDGVVDNRDFEFIKIEVGKRTEGPDLLADLNGNCKLESQDVVLMMQALKDKREFVY